MVSDEPDLRFEWDEAKRESTILKHEIDFRDAVRVFFGPHVVIAAASGTEERFRAIGPLNERFATVVFTMRGDVCRIITARRARDGEIRAYRSIHAL